MADETAGIRMLVVEDDKALSEIVCEELRERGHMAVAAESVAEGLEQLKQSEFEVALVDLMLPDTRASTCARQATGGMLSASSASSSLT